MRLFEHKSKITLYLNEFGKTKRFVLDDRNRWRLGRAAVGNKPDISLESRCVSRNHGDFLLVDDQLFYVDRGSINGTLHNGKMIGRGLNKRANPVLLNDGDVLRIEYKEQSECDPQSVSIRIKMTRNKTST